MSIKFIDDCRFRKSGLILLTHLSYEYISFGLKVWMLQNFSLPCVIIDMETIEICARDLSVRKTIILY